MVTCITASALGWQLSFLWGGLCPGTNSVTRRSFVIGVMIENSAKIRGGGWAGEWLIDLHYSWAALREMRNSETLPIWGLLTPVRMRCQSTLFVIDMA